MSVASHAIQVLCLVTATVGFLGMVLSPGFDLMLAATGIFGISMFVLIGLARASSERGSK